jgi:hypothetical protein
VRRDFCDSASSGSGGASPRIRPRPHIRISLSARLRSTAAKRSKCMNRRNRRGKPLREFVNAPLPHLRVWPRYRGACQNRVSDKRQLLATLRRKRWRREDSPPRQRLDTLLFDYYLRGRSRRLSPIDYESKKRLQSVLYQSQHLWGTPSPYRHPNRSMPHSHRCYLG